MTPKTQRIAIAEFVGWNRIEDQDHKGEFLWLRSGDCEAVSDLPNYVQDLNAIHEAVNFLDTEGSRLAFLSWLDFITTRKVKTGLPWLPKRIVSADAPEWAEALLRTIGKWKDEP